MMFLLKQLGVAAIYALLIYLDHRYFESGTPISSFEAPIGFAFAALLIGGKRYAWGVLLGATLIGVTTDPLGAAVIKGSGDTLEALCGAWLLTRDSKFSPGLRSLRDYLKLILFGAAGIGIASNLECAALLVFGYIDSGGYSQELLHRWSGDILGIALVTPLVITGMRTENKWPAMKMAEAALLLGLTFLAGQVVFLGWLHDSLGNFARGYVMFLFITWVAVRLGTRGTAVAIAVTGTQSTLSAFQGVGYFANDIAQSGMANYWIYMLTLSVVGMALATFLEALHRSETKFRMLYDSTGEAMLLMDEKDFIDCNNAALQMFGCATKEEFCSKHPIDLSPSQQLCGTDSLLFANQHITTALEQGSLRFGWACKRVDNGKIFFSEILLSTMKLEGKTFLQAIVRDVTEQKHAREEFERFFNLIPDMACIASTDGYFKKINRAWQTTLGYTEQEILSAPFLDFIHPDDIGATLNEVERQLAGGKSSRFSNRYRCKGGGYKLLEWDMIPPIDGTLLYGSARDVTEQRRAEEELNRFFDLVPDLVCIASADGRFLRVNRAWQTTLGYTEQEILSTPFLDFIHPDDRDATMKEVERQMAGKATMHFGNRYRCKDGSYKWLEWDATPAVDKKLLFASARDVTERKYVEDELRLTKERYDFATAVGKVGTWDWSPVTGVLLWSDETFRLMGFAPGSVVPSYELYLSLVHPDDRTTLDSAVKAALHDKKPYDLDCRIILGNGKELVCHVAGKVEFDAEARPVRMLGTIQDITERKMMENALLESSEAYHCIQSTSFDGFWFLDMGGKILEVNDRYCEQSGYSREELLKMSVTDIEAIESTAETAARISRIIKAGRGQFESMHRRKDGVAWHVEVSVICLASRGERMFAFMRDITERKRAEAALRESEERLRGIMNNASAVIFLKDTAGRYLLVNPLFEKLFHISNAAIQGKTDHDIFPKDMADAFVAADKKVIQAGQSLEVEERVPQDDGIHTYISVKFPLHNASGEIYAVCGIATDITERKAVEQQLHALSAHIQKVREEEKAHIAREIHDELGGTLAALKMDAYWLSRKLPANNEREALVERLGLMSQRINSAVHFTRRIISDLRPSILDDLGMLAAIEWLAENFQAGTGIKCKVSCIEDETDLDEQYSIVLFRVLQEALNNISRHSGASEVEIKFNHGEEKVVLEVSDNGCGIRESQEMTPATHASKSYGMLGMVERVTQLGGAIFFSSPPSGGFSLVVDLQLLAKEKCAK